MGFACGFGCLVAFVGLVGLYACNVRRIRIEKRNAAHFIGLFRPVFYWLALLYWLDWLL